MQKDAISFRWGLDQASEQAPYSPRGRGPLTTASPSVINSSTSASDSILTLRGPDRERRPPGCHAEKSGRCGLES